ncbi:urease accessory protein UreH domain-containing protein [Demequina mangrovi]|uniref:Sulfite exporter TauE/SafE n=1 Tax=Demequina mangrovi TaxID=1043493 RepID=A0A1H6WT50_9MICO|nr:sulfite exporter TauE/SafE family protein [Demequina mangrovi]SEJ17447.1 Sulfite exporter TauE/SafE [Demequina mangrovi]
MSERTVPIAGMTCAACERTVTAAVLGLPGIESASADRRAGRLAIAGRSLPSDADVDAALADTPYSVGTRPWLNRDPFVWRDLLVAVAVVGMLAAAAWTLGLASRVQDLTSGASAGSAVVVLGLGVAASVSTCMALVGGLVVSLAASVPSRASGIARLRPHLAFNGGRIVGFTALGAVIGLVGRSLAPSGLLLAVVVLLAASVMAIVGVRLTETSPRVAAWQLSLPGRWGAWVRGASADDARGGTPRALGMGAATFFLPCGFTQAVQVYALSTGSAREGALVMGLFAIGTTPGLLAAGAAAGAAATSRRPGAGRVLRGIGVAVIAFALVTASGAITQLAPGLGTTAVTATERTPNVSDVGGVQHVTTQVVDDGYSPATTVVYVDEPVAWTLEPVYQGCQSAIDAPSLGLDRLMVLFDAETVEFTPTETGTYRYSCAMGMYTGEFVAIERPDP